MVEVKGDEYRNRVLQWDRGEVVKVWEQMLAGNSPTGWPPGRLLEYLLLRACQLEGAEVTWPFQIHQRYLLEQIDGVIRFDWLSCLLECKHQQEPVDVDPILKLKAQLVRRPRMAVGALFSTSGFTESALSQANLLPPANVLLWNKREMDLALRQGRLKEGMHLKLKFAIEQGSSDVNLEDSP